MTRFMFLLIIIETDFCQFSSHADVPDQALLLNSFMRFYQFPRKTHPICVFVK